MWESRKGKEKVSSERNNEGDELFLGLLLFWAPFKWHSFASESSDRCGDGGKVGDEYPMVPRDPKEASSLPEINEGAWVVSESCDFSWVDGDSVLGDPYSKEVHLWLHKDRFG